MSNHPMGKETTFKCGGKARWFVEVQDLLTFANLLKLHTDKPYYILGNGSKTLCSDKGFDGLVISTKKLNKIEFDNDLVVCECGVNLFALNHFLAENSLKGLEWSQGIPASVGGAVIMNAGSFEFSVGQFVEKVEIFDNDTTKILDKSQLNFSYRNSSLKGVPVFRVWFKFEKGDKQEILNLQSYYLNKKTSTQPMDFGSAGSIFKRQGDIIPVKIIDKMGLKGVRIGGAEISEKHCGFIINKNNATATDIISLINLVKSKVKDATGIEFEEEIIIME